LYDIYQNDEVLTGAQLKHQPGTNFATIMIP
jgi:hypothetical protein